MYHQKYVENSEEDMHVDIEAHNLSYLLIFRIYNEENLYISKMGVSKN